MGLYSRYLVPPIDPGLAQNAQVFGLYLDSPTLADTSEHPLVLIKNLTTGSTSIDMVVFFRRLMVRAAFSGSVRFYAAPTITTPGSAATPTPRKVSGAASAINAYTASTIAASGTLIDMLSSYNYNPSEMSDVPIVIPAGTNMLVTYQASNTGAAMLFGMDWFEAP